MAQVRVRVMREKGGRDGYQSWSPDSCSAT